MKEMTSQLPQWAAGPQSCHGTLGHCRTFLRVVPPKGWGSWDIDPPTHHLSLIEVTLGILTFQDFWDDLHLG